MYILINIYNYLSIYVYMDEYKKISIFISSIIFI